MSELRAFLFGPPRFVLDGSLVTIHERKAIALLAYLAASRVHHSRDALATMLWPELSQSRARASLRHALWSLRAAGLGETIKLEQEQVGIDPNIRSDVIEFIQRLDEHRQHGHAPGTACSDCLSALTDAIRLYQDDFLAGFTLRDAPRFDEWQYFQREQWRLSLANAFECLVGWHSQQAEWEQAIAFSRRWVALDPLNEPAQRSLMRAYLGNHQRNLALQLYDTLKKTLDQEMGTLPENETTVLAEIIRTGKLEQGGAPSSGRESKEIAARFMERAAFVEKLAQLLAEVRTGRGRMVLLGAEAGGGKSTLIRYFCAGVRSQVVISAGMCDPLSTPQPYGPLWDIASDMNGDFSRILHAGGKPEQISRAFLKQLRSSQAVQLVVFEDLHWSDEATLDLLRFIGRRIESTRALVIASYREDEVEGWHPLRNFLGDLATATGIERLRLPPLSRRAVDVLLTGSDLDPDEVYRKTGGNPFFVTEMIASGVNRIPDHVREAVLARTARLTQAARSVLDSAAVIGPRADASLLIKMTGAEIAAIEACMATGMLLARGDGLEFRHELGRQAVLEAISPPRLLRLHHQALEALRASPRHSGDMARLAHHAEYASDTQAVLEYAVAAARQASTAGAHRQAAAQYERVLRFASGLPDEDRAQLLQAYAHECHLIDRNDQALQALEAAGQIWKKRGDRLKEGDNLCQQVNHLLPLGRSAEIDQIIHSAIDILSSLPDSVELANAYIQYARMLLFNSDFRGAVSAAKKAIDLGERFENVQILIRAHNTIGISLIYIGEEGGPAALEQSISLAREADDHVGVAMGYINLGRWTGMMYGWELGSQYIDKGIAHCAAFELDFYSYFILTSQASAYLYQGRWREAEETVQHLLSQPNLSSDTRFWALVILGRVRALRGDQDSSILLDEALGLAERFGVLMFLAPARAARAEAAFLEGQPERAREEVRDVYELAVKRHHIWYAGELGYWLWRTGAAVDLPGWAMPVFTRQMRGDWVGAAAEWDRRGQPYERAWALAGGNREARLEALEIFERLGAVPAASALRRRLRMGSGRGQPAIGAHS